MQRLERELNVKLLGSLAIVNLSAGAWVVGYFWVLCDVLFLSCCANTSVSDSKDQYQESYWLPGRRSFSAFKQASLSDEVIPALRIGLEAVTSE